MRERALAWGPALLWAALVFALSSRPTLPVVDLSFGRDKLAHFAAYAVFGLLLSWGTWRSGVSAWVAVLLGVLYGASDEIHQSFVPGRAAEVADWVADSLGVIAGTFLFYRRRLRPPRWQGRARDAIADSLRT